MLQSMHLSHDSALNPSLLHGVWFPIESRIQPPPGMQSALLDVAADWVQGREIQLRAISWRMPGYNATLMLCLATMSPVCE